MRSAILAALVLATPATAQEVWETFDRPGYPFRIEVPDHLFASRVKEGDRVVWESADGRVRLQAAGFIVGTSVDAAALLDSRQASEPDRIVTYEAAQDGWAVASGYESATREIIFYERIESGADGTLVGFSMTWPISRRDSVDETLGRIGRSLSVR